MWTYENETLGFKVNAQMTFDTAEEYDIQAGEDGAHLQALAAKLCYGGFNAQFRELLCERIENETGFKRRVKGTKMVGEKEVTVYEGEQVYINHVRTVEGGPSEEKLNEWAQEVAASIAPVGPGKSERGKPTKAHLETAQGYLNAWNRNESSFDKFKAAWSNANGIDYVQKFGDNSDLETVAKAVKANEDRKAKAKDLL